MIRFLFLAVLLASTYGEKNLKAEDHLLTMTKEEVTETANCIAKSGNKNAQKDQETCDKKMPQKIIAAFKDCAEEVLGSGVKDVYVSLAEDEGYSVKIYECINRKKWKYTAEETRQIVEFENCTRAVAALICPVKLQG